MRTYTLNPFLPLLTRTHYRTSLTSSKGELQVMFIDACTSSPPVVKWGYDDATLNYTSNPGSTDTYTVEELAACNSTDSTAVQRYINPGSIHAVLLNAIESNKPIYYQVGHQHSTHPECSVWSSVIHHVGIRTSDGTYVSCVCHSDES